MKAGHARRRDWAGITGLTVGLFLCIGLLSSVPLIREWQVRLADTFFRLAPPPRQRSPVVVVSIDDRSLQQYGRWPWSHELLGQITSNLAQAGAGAIGVDILLSEAQSPQHDVALAEAFRAAQRVIIVDKLANFPEGPRWIEPLPEFSQAAALGHAHAVLDSDSICRRFPPRELTLDGPRWAFAIEVARRTDPQRTAAFLAGYGIADSDQSAAVTVAKPVLARIWFRRDGFETISASDVLSGFDPAAVRGRPVLVGFGPTEIGDRLSTPLSRELPAPGVEVHAQILDSILSGRMLYDPPRLETGLIVLATCLLGIAAFHNRSGFRVMGVLLGLSAVIYGIAFTAFIVFTWIVPVGQMLLAVVIAPLLVYAADSFVVERSLTAQLLGLRTWLALRG